MVSKWRSDAERCQRAGLLVIETVPCKRPPNPCLHWIWRKESSPKQKARHGVRSFDWIFDRGQENGNPRLLISFGLFVIGDSKNTRLHAWRRNGPSAGGYDLRCFQLLQESLSFSSPCQETEEIQAAGYSQAHAKRSPATRRKMLATLA